MSTEILCTLSGKGGAGKTVLGLSMARVLSEAGLRCLFVDCDIVTHGATYFFETELEGANVTSLSDIMKTPDTEPTAMATRSGIFFIPSSLSPEKEDFSYTEASLDELFYSIKQYASSFDACILDCHAGFSPVVLRAALCSNRSLIVLEPDALAQPRFECCSYRWAVLSTA